jgi:hypothetical protein
MENSTLENRTHLENDGLIRRNAFLEETLREKQGMKDYIGKGSAADFRDPQS